MSENLDLDAVRAQLNYASNGIDGPDTQYHPHALAAMRASEKLLAEVERLRAQLDKPCGSCHPCANWPAETWKRAGRHLPDVHQYGEMEDALRRIRELIDSYPPGSDFAESGAQELFRRILDGPTEEQPVT